MPLGPFSQVPQPQSEDCLFLNVWTPGLDKEKRPVMVWIHGGAFTLGSGSDVMYDSEILPKRGNIVMVTINYRLGMLGATFAYNNRQGEIDYCYRAIHLTAVTAKEIIEAYYGDPPSYSYFVGCSTGGRQGLMEAQRFPMDFDGIVVGAPVLDFSGTQMWGIWNSQALLEDGNIPVKNLKILADAVYEKCDGVDGLVDGLINDPRNCTFDPATDLPPGSFTPAQVEALEKIYGGVKNSKGELLFPGQPVGAEVFAGGMSGWAMWVISIGGPSLQLLVGDSFMKYIAFEVDPGPDYDWTTYNFDTDPPKMAYISSILDATDPDLSEFKAGGGKIIHYHGWADTALNPFMSVNYYEDVLNFMGVEETMDFTGCT